MYHIYQVVIEAVELEYHHFCYSWASANLLVPLDQLYYQARHIANAATHAIPMTVALALDVVIVTLLL